MHPRFSESFNHDFYFIAVITKSTSCKVKKKKYIYMFWVVHFVVFSIFRRIDNTWQWVHKWFSQTLLCDKRCKDGLLSYGGISSSCCLDDAWEPPEKKDLQKHNKLSEWVTLSDFPCSPKSFSPSVTSPCGAMGDFPMWHRILRKYNTRLKMNGYACSG